MTKAPSDHDGAEAPDQLPMPAPMPVDREQWFRQLSLSNFVNSYYQFRDLQLVPQCRRVLIIGPGQGLDTAVLRWRGYDVRTFDIDETFNPDFVGSVDDLGRFGFQAFDAVIASHVLEHLPLPYLDRALSEIARVGRYALVYLPVHGRHACVRLIPGLRGIDVSLILDFFNYLHRPDGLSPRYMAGQHYWEVGMRGFRVKDLRRRMEKHFQLISDYRNKDWLPSYNFVMRSRANAP
ncbi:MAG TPA: class I SAM-dependent methyltransferase [Burkholderiales bacterium]|nr:class I SAM-dependent methyltransferase [Burkholderiales bacterium]